MSKQSTRDKILDAVFKEVYAKGYNGTSTAMILKECNIPKGSLYHYFPSKKEMVLSVIKERIDSKMNGFFGFDQESDHAAIDVILGALEKISEHEMLMAYGCPLNRLNQEMSSIDKDFDRELNIVYEKLKSKIKLLLYKAVRNKEIKKIDCDAMADFIIASVWGAISLSPSQSSKQRFLQTIYPLMEYLQSLKIK